MLHISRFVDKIKMLESRQAKDFMMSLREAKDLHGDITKLLLVLQELQLRQQQQQQQPEDNKVEISGGKW